ncbi:hypothetical protein BaRGS_00005228 [Batillaria attramentaria]|uniref:C-type lectin domain-containing protein n=1 Tax=Batillaria attramentaria TaxID=370345 RepID=A0ABD0LVM4_9CAEN
MSYKFGLAALALTLILGLSGAGALQLQGYSFERDPRFDGRKITDDPESLDLVGGTVIQCARACAQRQWCSSFFFTGNSSACSLHETVFWLASGSVGEESPGTRYYRVVAGWCPQRDGFVYSRAADMCVFIEWRYPQTATNNAHQECLAKGAGLASNFTPFKLDVLIDLLQRNSLSSSYNFYIGMTRVRATDAFEWMDGTPADSLTSYWADDEPGSSENCVVLKGAALYGEKCNALYYVCEALKP